MKAPLPPYMLNRGLESGDIVRSLAGHDQGEIFVVLKVKDGFVQLADGKTRPFDKPKRKRAKHVQKIDQLTDPEALAQISELGDAGQRNAAIRKLVLKSIQE